MRTVERCDGRAGELALRHDGREFEVVSDGVFLMSTAGGGQSERLLVRAALAAAARRDRVLIGGLGVGFSLLEALDDPSVREVTVVEIEEVVVDWHSTHLRAVTGAALEDERVRVVVDDVAAVLARGGRYDAVCVDVDNGPGWLVRPANGRLYGEEGLALLAAALAPGGALGVWSAHPAPTFEERLRSRFATVEVHQVPAPRGDPDHVYVARASTQGAQHPR